MYSFFLADTYLINYSGSTFIKNVIFTKPGVLCVWSSGSVGADRCPASDSIYSVRFCVALLVTGDRLLNEVVSIVERTINLYFHILCRPVAVIQLPFSPVQVRKSEQKPKLCLLNEIELFGNRAGATGVIGT